MGRGNVCVHGKSEGLIYIDYDDISLYQSKIDEESEPVLGKEITCYDDYEYLQTESELLQEDLLENIKYDFMKKYPSFTESADNGVWLENSLFTIEVEDNQWSMAIKLLQKEQSYCERGNIENLQHKHYQSYLNGLQECAFNYLDEIGIYGGPWTHGTLTKEEFLKSQQEASSIKGF